MIPKLKEPKMTYPKQSLDKKRINLTTLLDVIERVDDKKLFREFSNKIVLNFGNHFKNRNAKSSGISPSSNTKKTRNYDLLIKEFNKFYSRKYAKTTLITHCYQVEKFLDFVTKNYSETTKLTTIEDSKDINKQMVSDYEAHLVTRMYLDQIQKCTVYTYLLSMKLLLDMLLAIKKNNVFYFIPESLRANGKRSNEYVNLDEVVPIVELIGNSKSHHKFRNMSIILIITELGCRPIEIANLRLADIRISEHLITLRSVKSSTRTLTISKDLAKIIQTYLTERSQIQSEEDALFLSKFNLPMSSQNISSLFHFLNFKTFGEMRVTAKSLRHTYATNALDNQNDFDQVSESLGHKHRRSTEWYIYRSVQRLRERSLPHNPLNQINEVQ